MKKNPNKLWIIVFALGWLFDLLFWQQSPGINFALFTASCLIAAFYLLLGDGFRPGRASLILIPIFIFFAAVTFLRDESMTNFLSIVFTLLIMVILTMTYLGGRWHLYTLSDYLSKSLQLFGSVVGRPVTFMGEVRKA
ncbi:MAG: hypothetical protein KA473_10515, partial [Anaerolineales bacterium]|nr:hypothetical protein [Anaerolineales bacterium]MBP8164647.1 hypothetical protein [Anaerolineales bacterium]